jgi:hypothetical protein
VNWFVLACLVLAAYRLTRLVIKDTFPPVLWLRDKVVGGWRPLTEPEQYLALGDDPADVPFETTEVDGVRHRWVARHRWSPHWLAELMSCPWCASAYVSGALVAATDLTVGLPVPWLVGPAVWAGAALLASREWA